MADRGAYPLSQPSAVSFPVFCAQAPAGFTTAAQLRLWSLWAGPDWMPPRLCSHAGQLHTINALRSVLQPLLDESRSIGDAAPSLWALQATLSGCCVAARLCCPSPHQPRQPAMPTTAAMSGEASWLGARELMLTVGTASEGHCCGTERPTPKCWKHSLRTRGPRAGHDTAIRRWGGSSALWQPMPACFRRSHRRRRHP